MQQSITPASVGDQSDEMQTSSRNVSGPSGEWLNLQSNGKFDGKQLRSYWAHQVPKLFSPSCDCDCLNIIYNETAADEILFKPLDMFITASDDPKSMYQELKALDGPPKLCGRLLKSGEATYSCKDCGFDSTCVLCVECFKQSQHRNHKYRMFMSSGGGYCDCGDREAWKAHPFCDLHMKGFVERMERENSNIDPVSQLPDGLGDRSKLVIHTVVNYCYEMLTWAAPNRLPKDLEVSEGEDSDNLFVTMLFNDEIHTYDQVISTLSRAIECTHKEAIDFATTIDREGRSMVRCSPINQCTEVKESIEKITSRQNGKPLRVDVMLVSVVAHQTFAIRLLSWLQGILSHCEAFRSIFYSVVTQPHWSPGAEKTVVSSNAKLLELIMTADVSLWKTARNQWHQLFITGLLMESESKKNFAKIFTRIYSTIMRDFVTDDHEHSLSITSLSVQLYTCPSLAHTLIAQDDALLILFKTFLDECRRYLNHEHKLQFERNHQQVLRFRRNQYILNDLRYLLSAKPKEWTDEMRTKFMQAFVNLVDLFDWMQGMDAVVRQLGQHVEFESEWETGINLQLKLTPVISLIIEWCGTDRIILQKTLRHALKELSEKQPRMNVTSVHRNLLSYEVTDCIEYDVSSSPISVHLPLSRLIAGLLLQLTKYEIDYFEFSRDFILRGEPTLIELMELPLRTLVMIAQFRASMWRRNGYSLINQVYFYHNVRIREEMYDRDILMLQYVAAYTPPNEYLIHLIHKFGLFVEWAHDNLESHTRRPEEDFFTQTVTLIEEFLSLLLIIVSERHTHGVGKVTPEDRIRKEIIQALCVEPMTHSELLKILPRESVNETLIESLLTDVADFKRVGSGGGKYEVKPHYLDHFNPFFYHYTRQDQSTAEENQLKRKKAAGEAFICCPPPIPPEFSNQFRGIRQILNCDVMLHMIHRILTRIQNTRCLSVSESQFEKILHLIGVALHEEERSLTHSPDATSDSQEFHFTRLCVSKKIHHLLQQCQTCSRVEPHKELLRWLLDKFDRVIARRGLKITESDQVMSSCSVQTVDQEKKRNSQQAAERRARIMARMFSAQKSFMAENASFFDKIAAEEANTASSSAASTCPASSSEYIAVGPNQGKRECKIEEHTCILCREEQEVTSSGRCLVFAAFVQRSTVLSKNRERKVNFTDEAVEAIFMPADLYFGPHVSTCGHVMHSDCWQKYFEAVLLKERRRPVRYGRHVSFDIEKSEFLCPYCECLSNTVIPVLPCIEPPLHDSSKTSAIAMSDWIKGIHAVVEAAQTIWVKDPSMNIETGEKYICRLKPSPISNLRDKLSSEIHDIFVSSLKVYEENCTQYENLSRPILDTMKLLSQAIYTIGLNVHQNSEDDRVPVLSYWSCAFTIHSIERVLREANKAIFSDLSSRKFNCLQALVRYVGNSSGVFSAAVIRTHAIKLLKYLLVNEQHGVSATSCLDIDAFGLLVSLIMSSPSMHVKEDIDDPGCIVTPPLGNAFDRNYINLVLVLHLVQIILTQDELINQDITRPATPMDVDDAATGDDINNKDPLSLDLHSTTSFVCELLTAAGLAGRQANLPCGQELLSFLKASLLPFLRCSALLFHFLTSILPPSILRVEPASKLSPDDEFTILTGYLGLPCHLYQLLGAVSLRQLALNWARHPRVRLIAENTVVTNKSPTEIPLKLIRQPHNVNRLVQLPNDYSELINSVSQFTCPNSDLEDSREPTMCLVCGAMLCSHSYCCQSELDGIMVGACTNHSHICGAGVGIFLRVRDCKILLLAGRSKGCYMLPPYIDEFGETDQGLNRGNPLHLCEAAYSELQRLWLRHGIPEQIAHALEITSNLAATNWASL